MMRFMGQLMLLPIAVATSGFTALAKSLQTMEGELERRVSRLSDGWLRAYDPPEYIPRTQYESEIDDDPNVQSRLGNQSRNATDESGAQNRSYHLTRPIELHNYTQKSHSMEQKMSDFYSDDDLSGDGIKRVEYYVFFTRKDYVAELRKDTETISRNTTVEQYKGEVRAKFIADAENKDGKVDAPTEWKDDTPPGVSLSEDKKKITGISRTAADEFIEVKVRLLSRADEKKPNYEKEQAASQKSLADSQSKIANTLKEINNKL